MNELNHGGRVVKNELIHSGANETGPLNRGKLTTKDFYVYRMPRADKGVPRGPRVEVKPVKASKGKRAPGRPRVYNGTDRRIVAAALKKHGYTNGLIFLRKERKLKVSMTLARSVAKEHGIEFKRGRPAA